MLMQLSQGFYPKATEIRFPGGQYLSVSRGEDMSDSEQITGVHLKSFPFSFELFEDADWYLQPEYELNEE